MAKCYLCKKEKPLIKKSHIIPDFFYRECGVYNEKHKIHKIDIQEYIKNKKVSFVSTGVYDGGLLCKECDGTLIGNLEDYGRKVLYGGLSKSESIECNNFINPNDGFEFSVCNNVDYKKFKLFLLSILWRSSITGKGLFKEVLIKKYHQRRIRKMIYSQDSKEMKDYPLVIMSYINDSSIPKDLILQPIKSGSKGKTIITFLIGGFVFVFFISRRKKVLEKIKKMTLTKDGKLPIMFIPRGQGWNFIFKYANIK